MHRWFWKLPAKSSKLEKAILCICVQLFGAMKKNSFIYSVIYNTNCFTAALHG